MKQKMVSIALVAGFVWLFSFCANGKNNAEAVDSHKALVVYFSCTNHTKGVADYVADILGTTEFRILPAVAYTAEDLNYNNDCRANREQNDDKARPAIANQLVGLADVDVVYVGFPIWWGKLPKIMYTFFDTYDFSGKTIIPFCTSGSSGIATAVSEIRSLEPNATVLDGRRFDAGASRATVESWVKTALPTGVGKVEATPEASKAYNLLGQAVGRDTKGEILLLNHKKVRP